MMRIRQPWFVRGDVHFEHRWMTIERLSVGPSEPLYTLGTDAPPFSLDPLLPVDFDDGLMRWCERYAVARDVPSRAPMMPAWVVAAAEALWGSSPATGLGEVVTWAMTTPDPPAYAQAVIVVYEEKRREDAAFHDESAVKRLGLLREAMRELGDPQGLPDATRDD